MIQLDNGSETIAAPELRVRAEEVPVSPVFQVKPVRVVVLLVVLALFFGVVWMFATSPNIEWRVFREYLFSRQVFQGIGLTILLTIVSMVLGIILGTLTALAKMSDIFGLRLLSNAYIWVFRGTPLMVQVIFMFNLSLFLPSIMVGSLKIETNAWMTSMTAAILALSLNEGAYMAEFIRGGIQSVSSGQREAAISQGMTNGQALRRIILPQALPSIIPSIGNQTISMLKSTSIVSVIAAAELLTQVQIIYNQNFRVIELLLVACAWYLFMVTIASILQYFLERKLGQRSDHVGTAESGRLLALLRSNLRPFTRKK